MPKTVASMNADELHDPDAGLTLRPDVRRRLLRQRRAVAKGDRGKSLETVVRRLWLQDCP